MFGIISVFGIRKERTLKKVTDAKRIFRIPEDSIESRTEIVAISYGKGALTMLQHLVMTTKEFHTKGAST